MEGELTTAAAAADGVRTGGPSETLGSRLRSRRRELGLTLQQVGDGANLSVGFISQIERDLTTPSLSSLAAISRVLQAHISEFFVIPGGGSLTTRARTRGHYSLDERNSDYERVTANFPGHVLNGVIMHEPPGYRSEPIRHEGEEFFFVLNGSITVELDGKATILNTGDSIHFRSNREHSTWNHTAAPASVLVVVTMDIFGEADTEKMGRIQHDSGPGG